MGSDETLEITVKLSQPSKYNLTIPITGAILLEGVYSISPDENFFPNPSITIPAGTTTVYKSFYAERRNGWDSALFYSDCLITKFIKDPSDINNYIYVSGYWNPIETDAFRSKILALTAGVRCWRFEPHVGLFWGLHTTVAKYKVGRKDTRYNGWLAGVGSSVGYSWMLSKRWNFSLEGGLGFFYMKDTRWNPNTSPLDDVVLHHYRRVVIAPSKLEVSFSYLF